MPTEPLPSAHVPEYVSGPQFQITQCQQPDLAPGDHAARPRLMKERRLGNAQQGDHFLREGEASADPGRARLPPSQCPGSAGASPSP